jgi:hypothetical protein
MRPKVLPYARIIFSAFCKYLILQEMDAHIRKPGITRKNPAPRKPRENSGSLCEQVAGMWWGPWWGIADHRRPWYALGFDEAN